MESGRYIVGRDHENALGIFIGRRTGTSINFDDYKEASLISHYHERIYRIAHGERYVGLVRKIRV